MPFFWFMTAAGAVLGGFFTYSGLVDADSAIQQAAAAAVGVACAVIPYCFARAVSEMKLSFSNENDKDPVKEPKQTNAEQESERLKEDRNWRQ